MTLPPLPLVDGALFIDNSFLENLITCPRKLQYANLLKRIPSGDAPALNFGSCVHSALEYRYKTCRNEMPTEAQVEAQKRLIIDWFDKNPQAEDEPRSTNFAIDLMRHYNAKYPIEPFHLITNDKNEVMLEMSFALPLFEYFQPNGTERDVIPIIYTGRIDLPVVWDEQIIIIDHKTASTLGYNYFDQQRVSPQFEGYCWAFEQLTQKKVSGFCINALRSKELPTKPRGGIDAWWDEGLQRHKEYLKPGQLDEWKTNAIMMIKEFMWHYQNDYMPTKKKACTLYKKCPYYDVCYQQAADRPRALRSDSFQDNTWSPLTS